MGIFDTSINHPLGAHPGAVQKIRAYIRDTSVSKGHVVTMLLDVSKDLSATVDTTDGHLNIGSATSPTSNFEKSINGDVANAAGGTRNFFAVALEDITAGTAGWVALSGRVQALVTTANVVGGSALSVGNTAGELDSSLTGDTILAVAHNDADNAANGLTYVFFDGINGFGSVT